MGAGYRALAAVGAPPAVLALTVGSASIVSSGGVSVVVGAEQMKAAAPAMLAKARGGGASTLRSGASAAAPKSSGSPVNKAGKPYPNVTDPRTGKPMTFPEGPLERVPASQRVEWTNQDRGRFIKEWYDRGYQTPQGGWSEYDIHHIRPREFGGTNDFDNLVPVLRDVHNTEVTPWWNGF
jgi:hypothetical protein